MSYQIRAVQLLVNKIFVSLLCLWPEKLTLIADNFLLLINLNEMAIRKESKKLQLLAKKSLLKTGDVDHADWNYKPVLGIISRARFNLIKKLLENKQGKRLLEIGYGSGIFFPELAKYGENIYGIDVHNEEQEVAKILTDNNIAAELVSGVAEKMPWPDNFFDFIIAVSTLEFVSDLEAVCGEIKRMLKPQGSFFMVTPGKSAILDFGLKVFTGESAKKDFDNRRDLILPAVCNNFNIKQEKNWPSCCQLSPIKVYTALELELKNS